MKLIDEKLIIVRKKAEIKISKVIFVVLKVRLVRKKMTLLRLKVLIYDKTS